MAASRASGEAPASVFEAVDSTLAPHTAVVHSIGNAKTFFVIGRVLAASKMVKLLIPRPSEYATSHGKKAVIDVIWLMILK